MLVMADLLHCVFAVCCVCRYVFNGGKNMAGVSERAQRKVPTHFPGQ